MANLQLNIYTFVLEELGKRGDNREFFNFGEFFRTNFKREQDPIETRTTPDRLYKNFMEDFTNSFHNEFKLNKNQTRAIGLDQTLNLRPSKHLIEGLINGGATGIEQGIYDKKNMDLKETSIDKDKVATLPYYYKIWTPYDSQVGVIMIQSYTDYSVSGLIINQIKEVFKKYNARFISERHITKQLRENFINKSHVYKMSIFKNKLSKNAREKFNNVFTDHQGLKIKVDITGFNENPETFLKKLLSSEHVIGSNLRDLEINEDSDYDTVIYYKDHLGRKAHAKIETGLSVKPTYYLNDDLKKEGTDYADFEKIKKYTDGILEVVKEEIEYSVSTDDKENR